MELQPLPLDEGLLVSSNSNSDLPKGRWRRPPPTTQQLPFAPGSAAKWLPREAWNESPPEEGLPTAPTARFEFTDGCEAPLFTARCSSPLLALTSTAQSTARMLSARELPSADGEVAGSPLDIESQEPGGAGFDANLSLAVFPAQASSTSGKHAAVDASADLSYDGDMDSDNSEPLLKPREVFALFGRKANRVIPGEAPPQPPPPLSARRDLISSLFYPRSSRGFQQLDDRSGAYDSNDGDSPHVHRRGDSDHDPSENANLQQLQGRSSAASRIRSAHAQPTFASAAPVVPFSSVDFWNSSSSSSASVAVAAEAGLPFGRGKVESSSSSSADYRDAEATSNSSSNVSITGSPGAEASIDNIGDTRVTTARPDPVHAAVALGASRSSIEALLVAGAYGSALDDNARTPLHVAAASGHVDALSVLLECGSYDDLFSVDCGGNTPLHLAVQCGHSACVTLLLSYGADVTALNTAGYAPAHLLTSQECLLALANFCDESVLVVTSTGGTLLHVLAKLVSAVPLHAALQLPALTARQDAQDMSGMTALHIAASYDNLGSLAVLSLHGCDTRIRDAQWRIPAELASSAGASAVSAMLSLRHMHAAAHAVHSCGPSMYAEHVPHSYSGRDRVVEGSRGSNFNFNLDEEGLRGNAASKVEEGNFNFAATSVEEGETAYARSSDTTGASGTGATSSGASSSSTVAAEIANASAAPTDRFRFDSSSGSTHAGDASTATVDHSLSDDALARCDGIAITSFVANTRDMSTTQATISTVADDTITAGDSTEESTAFEPICITRSAAAHDELCSRSPPDHTTTTTVAAASKPASISLPREAEVVTPERLASVHDLNNTTTRAESHAPPERAASARDDPHTAHDYLAMAAEYAHQFPYRQAALGRGLHARGSGFEVDCVTCTRPNRTVRHALIPCGHAAMCPACIEELAMAGGIVPVYSSSSRSSLLANSATMTPALGRGPTALPWNPLPVGLARDGRQWNNCPLCLVPAICVAPIGPDVRGLVDDATIAQMQPVVLAEVETRFRKLFEHSGRQLRRWAKQRRITGKWTEPPSTLEPSMTYMKTLLGVMGDM